MIEVVGPVKRAASGAETFLTVAGRRVPCQRGTEVQPRFLEFQPQVQIRVADPIRRGGAGGRTRCPDKIDRDSQRGDFSPTDSLERSANPVSLGNPA